MKKSIDLVLSMLMGGALGGATACKFKNKKITQMENMSEKHLSLFLMMNQWVKVKQEGKNLAAYFEEHNYKKIAVYGMSYAGETLINELKDTDITIAYGIDKKAESIYVDVDIVTMEDHLEDVDAVVVTAVTFFSEIEEKLNKILDCPIISLEDILFEV